MKFKKQLSLLGVLVALSLASCGTDTSSSQQSSAGSSESSASESSQGSSQQSDTSTESSEESKDTSSSEESKDTSSSEESKDSSSPEESSAEPSSSSSEPAKELPDLGEPTLALHYHREDDEYKGWNLWMWPEGGNGEAYQFNYSDSYGAVALYPLSTWKDIDFDSSKLGFIIRLNEWKEKDVDADRFIDFSQFEMDSKQTYHVYTYTKDSGLYDDPETPFGGSVTEAKFTNETKITLKASKTVKSYKIYENDEVIKQETLDKPKSTVSVTLSDFTFDFDKDYSYEVILSTDAVRSGDLEMKSLYSTDAFNDKFAYDGELGALYTPSKTTFKVWSPFSSAIQVKLYNTGTPHSKGGSDETFDVVDMVKGEKGVFSAEVNGDLEGKYYTYVVTNKQYNEKEIVDPYAKSAGVSGLRGMIVDFSKTNPTGWDEVEHLGYDRKELTVYETHVADVTSSTTWGGTPENAKLFKGMYEEGTTYTEGGKTVKTGFDHIKELGVNAVQILPLFDQDNDEQNMSFNWGYNPLNYNVVEGGYSSNPEDGYVRIREFKELVQAYNKAGIEIIMDVVYNHVSSAQGSNFDVLVPGYYYRYNGNALSNGSGCGNETASENYMFRKFMIDSTSFWLTEYKLDGFRFDLMGLHDIETMNQLTAKALEINPKTVIYGEPWDGGSSPLPSKQKANQANVSKFVGYGQFNDQIRNTLHGGVFDDTLTDLGWCDLNSDASINKADEIKRGMSGATGTKTSDPNKTVNYVTCHDNRTLFDRIVATGKYDAEKNYKDIVKMIDVAHAVVMLSEGTSFMLAGEEFARTKGGDHNSYQSSYKVNELDYALKVKNYELFTHMQQYIKIKQENALLHLEQSEIKTALTFSFDSSNSIVKMKAAKGTQELVVIIHNSNAKEVSPEFDLTGYNLVFDSVNSSKALTNKTTVERFEVLVASK